MFHKNVSVDLSEKLTAKFLNNSVINKYFHIKEEQALLEPFYSSVKEVAKEKKPLHSNMDIEALDIDITYHTTISDYEKVLGEAYASA